MSWESFWLPNIIQATLFATLAAITGVLVRRWLKDLKPLLEQIFGSQERIATAAEDASTQANVAAVESRRAADSAGAASAQASDAEENTRLAHEALVFLAEQIGARDTAIDQLREGNDRLLGALARQLAPERPTGFLVPRDAGEEDDLTTVTGRHRLHTQHLSTIDEGDHP